MVPKIFHQVWFGWDTPEPPPMAQEAAQTWKNHHPDWEFRLWSAAECRKLIKDHYRFLLKRYDSYPYPIQQADAVRYCILHKHGGIYIDHDYVCTKNILPLLAQKNAQVYLSLEPHVAPFAYWPHQWKVPPILPVASQKNMFYGLLSNAFMASAAGSGFLTYVIRLLGKVPVRTTLNVRRDILETAGGLVLSRAYRHYRPQDEIEIFTPEHLQPITDKGAAKLRGVAEWVAAVEHVGAYAGHMWNCASTPQQGGVEGMSRWVEQKVRPPPKLKKCGKCKKRKKKAI